MADPTSILTEWLVKRSDDLRLISEHTNIPVNDLIFTIMDDAVDSWLEMVRIQKESQNESKTT